jgi:hypothetical protein
MLKKEHLTYDTVKKAMFVLGHPFHTGEFRMNRIGIRTTNQVANNFDDFFVLCWQEKNADGKLENKIFVETEFTTDPGLYYMQEKLLNPKGCGILAEGYYEDAHAIGKHGKDQYEAFVQVGPMTCYRDRNKDNILDFDPLTKQTGSGWGCNQHHAYGSKNVGKNSAMCQVQRHKVDLDKVLTICKKQIKVWKKTFSYALIHQRNFNFINGVN